MRAVDIIARKRDGEELSTGEIDFFIQGYTRGDIPDYQAAAWLMAVYLRGMNERETVDLTVSMARSGRTLNLKDVVPFVVDKHSTGGVGDKTTLVVAPLVAATGQWVGKMSGHGLGFSGGTLDKLESIRGYRAELSVEEFKANLKAHGIVVAGQTADLAPADGKLYALRDVTGTVPSLPLIASSVMSKKIAAGADAIVLDVKVGRGAFMKTGREALALAQIMVDIGQGVGRRAAAIISDMNQPLGYAIGNALEVREAIATLKGQGPPDFLEHCLTVAGQMLLLAEQVQDAQEAQNLLRQTLGSGRGLSKFEEWIASQGGDLAMVRDPDLLPQATIVRPVEATRSGYVAGIDAMELGLTAMHLGAGRPVKQAPIDHAVGLVLHKKVGDQVERGEPLFTLHARHEEAFEQARQRALAAYTYSKKPSAAPPLIHKIVR